MCLLFFTLSLLCAKGGEEEKAGVLIAAPTEQNSNLITQMVPIFASFPDLFEDSPYFKYTFAV